MYSIYRNTPWLLPVDVPEISDFFKATGQTLEIKAHTELSFGREKRVYFIESGLIATFTGSFGHFERMGGLFGRNTTLGGIKAVTHPGEEMLLLAHALSDCHLFYADEVSYRTFIERDATFCARVYKNYILKNEAEMEGFLINDLLPVSVRLAKMIRVLYQAGGVTLTSSFCALPWPVTMQELAALVHSDRVVVSRIFSQWLKDGYMKKHGRTPFFCESIVALSMA